MKANQPRSPERVLEWLLEGDPAIRWQTKRDLLGSAKSLVERERQRVAVEGWGALLLAKQDARDVGRDLHAQVTSTP